MKKATLDSEMSYDNAQFGDQFVPLEAEDGKPLKSDRAEADTYRTKGDDSTVPTKKHGLGGIVQPVSSSSEVHASPKGAVPDAHPAKKQKEESKQEDSAAAQSKEAKPVELKQGAECTLEMFAAAWQYKVKAGNKKQKNNVKLDQYLKKSITELDIRVPVQHVKGNQYLFGHQKVQAELKDGKL